MKRVILRIGWLLMLTWAFGLATYAKGEEIAFNLGAEPVSVDPLYAVGRAEAAIINNLYQGLVCWKDGRLSPGVAGKWIVSEDGLQYRFQLRATFWSNGDPVVAKDFETAWKRVINPKSTGSFCPLFNIIHGVEEYRKGAAGEGDVGIKAIGKNILWVKLAKPCSQFLAYLTLPSFMPVNAKMVEKEKNRNLMGDCTNGPFTVAKWEKRRFILLEANPKYRGVPSKVSSVRMVFLNADTASSAFKAGVIKGLTDPNLRMVRDLAPFGELRQVPVLSCSFIFFNLQRPPLDRQEVRKAFSLVADKERLIQRMMPNQAWAAKGFIPFGVPDFNGKEFRAQSSIPGETLDGEQARRLLWQAGYPGETEFPPMEIIYRAGDLNQQTMEMLAKMWRIDLGINLELTPLPWPEFKRRCSEGRYYLARAGWDGDYPDPMAMLELFRSDSAANFCHYQNVEFDQLLNKAEQVFGSERSQVLHEAEKVLMRDLPIIPLYFSGETYILDKSLKSLEFTPQGYPMFWTAMTSKA